MVNKYSFNYWQYQTSTVSFFLHCISDSDLDRGFRAYFSWYSASITRLIGAKPLLYKNPSLHGLFCRRKNTLSMHDEAMAQTPYFRWRVCMPYQVLVSARGLSIFWSWYILKLGRAWICPLKPLLGKPSQTNSLPIGLNRISCKLITQHHPIANYLLPTDWVKSD